MYDEANTRIQFARMPFDLGDDAAGFCPTPGLIGEVRIGSAALRSAAAQSGASADGRSFLAGCGSLAIVLRI